MKLCPVCGSVVKGRKDKVYCSVKCKSSAQYEKRLVDEQFYLKVDKQLKTNRKILKKYNLEGHTTLRKEVLHNDGFNPNFFTHYWKNQKGAVYLFCYEFGFLSIKDNGKESLSRFS